MNYKKGKYLLAFTLFVVAGVSRVNAQVKHEWKQGREAGYTYRYVSGDPMHARFYRLKNGLTVILSVNKKEPRIQTLIGVRAGSNNDPKDHTGLAHYLEHLLFKGTDKYGSLDWAKEKHTLTRLSNCMTSITILPMLPHAKPYITRLIVCLVWPHIML